MEADWLFETEAEPGDDMKHAGGWHEMVLNPTARTDHIVSHLDKNWMIDSVEDDGSEIIITVRTRPGVYLNEDVPRRRFRKKYA